MKKISVAMLLTFIIMLLPCFSVIVRADTTNNTDYNFNLETLFNTSDAKELNKYRKSFLNYFNEQVRKERQATGNNSYKFLKLDDLDFTDNSKISGLKIHGSYSEYEFNAQYENFVGSLETHDFWCLNITKENTLYDVWIFKSKTPEKYGNNSYKIGGSWYIYSCELYLEEHNWTGALIYNTDIVKNNIEHLLKYYNVEGTDIKVVFTNMNYMYTNCGVIFIEGTAKYIYADNFSIPYFYNDNPDVPQEVQDVLSECSNGLFRGSYEQGTTEVKKFRDYNMVISLFRLYEYYSKSQ